jgi:hypothetical protein
MFYFRQQKRKNKKLNTSHLMWIKIGILTLGALALACKSLPKENECSIIEAVKQNLSNPIIEYNSSRDFALCYEGEPKDASGLSNFIIIKSKNCSIVEKGNYRPGYIKWISTSEVEVLNLPGAVDGDLDLTTFKKIISIKTPKTQ